MKKKAWMWLAASGLGLAGCEHGVPGAECDPASEYCNSTMTQAAVEGAIDDSAIDPPPHLMTALEWAGIDDLVAQDGIPRVPLWTAWGLVAAPYDIVDGRIVVQDGHGRDVGSVAELEGARERGVALSYVWFPSGSFSWWPDDLDSGTLSNVQAAMEYLEDHTPIETTQISGDTSARTLQILGTNSSAYGGMTYDYWNQNDDQPVIRLSQDGGSASINTTLHELGHALGFPHEFQRPDRDDFVDVCFNLDPFNYGELGSNILWLQDHSTLSPYDLESIMDDGYSSCITPLDSSASTTPRYDGSTQRMSVADINSIYRVYSDSVDDIEEDAHFGRAVAAGDFDDDGFEDIVVANNEPNGSTRKVRLDFFRGVETDPNDGDSGRRYVGWFAYDIFTGVTDEDMVPALAVGDFNGDGIDDLAAGDSSYDSNEGRVKVLTINTPDRFGSTEAPWGAGSVESVTTITASAAGLTDGYAHKFGAALAAGRLTSTTRDDLVVGAPTARQVSGSGPMVAITKMGGAVVHLPAGSSSGAAVLWNPGSIVLGNPYGEFGASVAVMRDFCKPSTSSSTRYGSIVVGAPGYDGDLGQVRLYGCSRTSTSSTAITPTLVKSVDGAQTGARYGHAIAPFTINTSSTGREFYLLIGAPEYEKDGVVTGKIYLDQHTETGTKTYIIGLTLSSPTGGDDVGYAVAVDQTSSMSSKNDVRVAVGIPGWETAGKVWVWYPWVSGSTSSTVVSLEPTESDAMRFGEALAPLENGLANSGFVVGAPEADIDSDSSAGRIHARLNESGSFRSWDGDTQKLNAETAGDREPSN